jgi:hypothetical protein
MSNEQQDPAEVAAMTLFRTCDKHSGCGASPGVVVFWGTADGCPACAAYERWGTVLSDLTKQIAEQAAEVERLQKACRELVDGCDGLCPPNINSAVFHILTEAASAAGAKP